MQDLIDAIKAAVASGATTEQKAAGVQACRTIVAALDAEPGKPLVPPIALPAMTATRPTLDQVLDLAIARLTTIANARDVAAVPTAPKVSAVRDNCRPGFASRPRCRAASRPSNPR